MGTASQGSDHRVQSVNPTQHQISILFLIRQIDCPNSLRSDLNYLVKSIKTFIPSIIHSMITHQEVTLCQDPDLPLSQPHGAPKPHHCGHTGGQAPSREGRRCRPLRVAGEGPQEHARPCSKSKASAKKAGCDSR